MATRIVFGTAVDLIVSTNIESLARSIRTAQTENRWVHIHPEEGQKTAFDPNAVIYLLEDNEPR